MLRKKRRGPEGSEKSSEGSKSDPEAEADSETSQSEPDEEGGEQAESTKREPPACDDLGPSRRSSGKSKATEPESEEEPREEPEEPKPKAPRRKILIKDEKERGKVARTNADRQSDGEGEGEERTTSSEAQRSPYSGPVSRAKRAPSSLTGAERQLYYVMQDHQTIADDREIRRLFKK